MKEAEFLDRIKTKQERTKGLIQKILNDGKKLDKRRNKFKILSKLKMFNRKNPVKIIEENLNYILSQTSNEEDFFNTIIFLMQTEETRDIVKSNMNTVLNNIVAKEKANPFIRTSYFLATIKEIYGKEYINDNIDKIIKVIPPQLITEQIQELKGISEKVDHWINIYIEKNKSEFAKETLQTVKIKGTDRNERKNMIDKFTPTILNIFEELKRSEHVEWKDIIEYKRDRRYSNVYKIGNKVLRIGGPKKTFTIPNHRRILQPLTRTNLIDELHNESAFACIEVTNRVKRVTKDECSLDELYSIYKELRDSGIIWADAQYENVGRLIYPNSQTHYLNDEKINVVPTAVGFKDDKPIEELPSGSIVLKDTDYLYSENEYKIMWTECSYSKQFEDRWQKEKQGEIVPSFKEKQEMEKDEEIR